MTAVALSTGCFIGDERRLRELPLGAVELSAHRPERLGTALSAIAAAGAEVASVHCPSPSRGTAINLAARGDAWQATRAGIEESFAIASELGASYVIVHAFYCVDDLPADDLARMSALRRLFPESTTMREYLRSVRYLAAKERAIANIRTILPSLRRRHPGPKLILENLNPRWGYGGIHLQDIVDIVEPFGGDVGVCLDIGHLTLASVALDDSMELPVAAVRDLVWSVHVHQNFGGAYYVDRRWNADVPQPHLQELDTHLPLLGHYAPITGTAGAATPENSAFEGRLIGAARYVPHATQDTIPGAVPVERMLSLLPSSNLVLEYDSRYAPLCAILHEARLAGTGSHPALSR